MSAAIVAILLVVPLALGVWLWLNLREKPPPRRLSASSVPRRVEQAKGRKPSPYTMQDGDVALSFRVGNRYYDETKNRVFECIALKGKKARLVAFALLDSVEWEKEQLAKYHDTGDFHKVRTDGGVETCQRGALRADRQATEKEVAAEFDFLRRLRTEHKPNGSIKMEITVGDKTFTSG